MSQNIIPVDVVEAKGLLEDADFQGRLFTEPFDASNSQPRIVPLEGSLAERFGCDKTAEGFHHLSFALDSTWKMIDGLYQKKQVARPKHIYAGYDTSEAEMVVATYIVPFGAVGQDSKAVELTCAYNLNEVNTRGKTYRKLGRQTLVKGVIDNPFYATPKKPEDYQGRVTTNKLISSYRRQGNFGTIG